MCLATTTLFDLVHSWIRFGWLFKRSQTNRQDHKAFTQLVKSLIFASLKFWIFTQPYQNGLLTGILPVSNWGYPVIKKWFHIVLALHSYRNYLNNIPFLSSTFGSSRVGCKIADVAGLSRPLLDTRFRAYIARLLAICNQNLKVNKQATDWYLNIFAHFTVLKVLFKLIVYINKTNGWLN